MSKNNLPPLDFSEDKAKLKAHEEVREIEFRNCKHKDVKYADGSLKCSCGVSWTGPRLNELYDALKARA